MKNRTLPSGTATLGELLDGHLRLLTPQAAPESSQHESQKFRRHLLERLRSECHMILNNRFGIRQQDHVLSAYTEFMTEVTGMIRDADEKGKKLTEADIVRQIPSNKLRKLIFDTRCRALEAYSSYRAAQQDDIDDQC